MPPGLFALAMLLPCADTAADNVIHLPVLSRTNDDSPRSHSLTISARHQWSNTEISVERGETLTITASGRIKVGAAQGESKPSVVGPEGTYHFPDEAAKQAFPLPAGSRGPAPCYGLIAKIGDSDPFFIGRHRSWRASHSGTLLLGINDHNTRDNSGHFRVAVERGRLIHPVAYERVVRQPDSVGSPVRAARVVVFYVDGLRPDVVREMAALGHLPNIRKHFIENGTWLSNSFTAFPSDTITSNGTMWTGCFSDRHGLKGQIRFSRRSLTTQSYLEPLGPNRGSRLLSPTGLDRLLLQSQTSAVAQVKGRDAAERFEQSRTTAVAPLYEHLRNDGRDWSTGALPLMTEMPPLLWTRSMVRYMPWFRSNEAWKFIDDANTDYAIQHLIPRDNPVTIIWLPETDTVSHKLSRGQFGMTRRTIARADLLIGRVLAELATQKRLHDTCLMLVSDHGHHGGRLTHLAHFDLANEVFHRPRERTPEGRWVSGGLGLSVRQHRYWNRHTGDKSTEFVFIDGESSGAARIYLPRGHYRSGQWLGPHRPGLLLNYRINPDLPPVNIVDMLTRTRAVHPNGRTGSPVDLVLLRMSKDAFLISTLERGHALVERRRNSLDQWEYRYTVIENVHGLPTGGIGFDVTDQPRTDPLHLVRHLDREQIRRFHDERQWLELTVGTRYPDSVVALARHMLWQDNLSHRQTEFEPDLVVTARPGWFFGTQRSPGTMHGYPLRDSMLATWFISGPGIRRGARVETPCRLVDLTPTILEIVGDRFDPKALDGNPLRTIWNTPSLLPSREKVATGRMREPSAPDSNSSTLRHVAWHTPDPDPDNVAPVYWRDVDLTASRPLDFDTIPDYEHAAISINRPSSPVDLNNIAYSLTAVANQNVFRIADDLITPLTNGRRVFLPAVESLERRARRSGRRWLSQGASVINGSQLVVGDYSVSSDGNLRRADGVIDWTQARTREVERALAEPLEQSRLPGAPAVHHGVDLLQSGIWEAYRFAQRVLVQILDETILNGIENTTDRTINRLRTTPAETVVRDPGSPDRRAR